MLAQKNQAPALFLNSSTKKSYFVAFVLFGGEKMQFPCFWELFVVLFANYLIFPFAVLDFIECVW